MIEKIGKITLDLTHYPGQDFYCDGTVEDELLEIVKKYDPVEFPQIIEERKSWPILYHLSTLRENIVNWLPINKSMKVLEVGSGCGAITGALSAKAGSVTCIDLSKKRSSINAHRHCECDNITIHVGNFQDIEPDLPTDFDYICLIGVFEYGQSYIGGDTPFEDFLKIIKKHCGKGGKIAIAIENKYGLKYWAGCKEDHLGTFFSSLEDYPDGGGVRTFSRKGLENIFQATGENQYAFYYPYPDYKFMKMVYSDKYLPKVGELSDNARNFDRDRMVLFDEKNVFDGMIREGMFPFYSNSYMAIIGEEPQVVYARFSNDRAVEYGIKTEIIEVNDKKTVKKYGLSTEANNHMIQVATSGKKLQKRYEGGKLSINTCTYIEENRCAHVEFEYVEGVTLAEILDQYINKNDVDGFQELLREYVRRIDYHSDMQVADYDLIFSNILVQGDNWTVIDYEWTFEKIIETKEIVFRSIYCYLLENEKRNRMNFDFIMEELGITEEDIETYREHELIFQKHVTGKRLSMPEIRNVIGYKMFAPEKWITKFEQAEGKERVQIYEDRGNGFSEEQSYFVKDAYMSESMVTCTLEVGGDVQCVRIDPMMDSCIVKVKELTFNGVSVPLSKRKI
ncbi:MAG: class I SAM-dependent methyltransferase, partial [Eubacteriales bacterium]